jgi:DNA anti-recombination protein RmuC
MAANDDVNKVNENLRKTTEELSYVADAFTSLAAQLEEVFSRALGNAEELDSVSQSIAKSYQRDIVSSIKQMSKNTEQANCSSTKSC